jgi:ABC-type lipoprotein release transport system permease subunit
MQIPAAGASPYASPSPQASTGMTPARTKTDTAVDDFMAYAKMTPAQKMRAAILGSMNLTEDQLKGMDPKERAKVEEKIKEMIQEKVEQSVEKQTGAVIDLKA